MSLTTELEGLRKEKAQLQRILQSVEEEGKYLEGRLRIVEEKIAIRVLKEKIKERRAVVEQLKSKVWNLEKRLNEPQKKEPMEVTVSAVLAGRQKPEQSEEQKEKQERTIFR